MNSMEQEEYLESQTNRIRPVADEIKQEKTADDRMVALLDVLTETVPAPETGRFYTFVYLAKTPRIRYDQNPLIACTEVLPWGFRGINFHWNSYRNYTWEEVVGDLHLVYPNEMVDAKSIPFQYFRINN